MQSKVIILGARGRFGAQAVHAFSDAGWEVTALGRSFDGTDREPGVRYLIGDALNRETLQEVCRGHDVIVNAVNPPYPDWPKVIPPLTEAVIAAARTSGATVMIPGNVYNYGTQLPPVLDEATPHIGDHRKAQLRIDMERAYRAAEDIQTIVLRAGDFMEQAQTGNWFDSYMVNKIHRGKVTYPGPLDLVHAWAYLPDMARAMADIAEKRTELSQFEDIGYPGFALTGEELVAHLQDCFDQPLRIQSMPWRVMRMLGLFVPLIREVCEMEYLWRMPHRIDGGKLNKLLPDFIATPTDVAIRRSLPESVNLTDPALREVPVA